MLEKYLLKRKINKQLNTLYKTLYKNGFADFQDHYVLTEIKRLHEIKSFLGD